MSVTLFPVEDRESARRMVRFPCQVVTEDDFRLVAESALDLSTTGMRVRALRYAKERSHVIVSFRIPDSSVWLDAEGVLSRILWGRRDEDAFPAYGIEFTRMPRMEGAVLDARLRELPITLPERRVRIDYAETVRRIARAA